MIRFFYFWMFPQKVSVVLVGGVAELAEGVVAVADGGDEVVGKEEAVVIVGKVAEDEWHKAAAVVAVAVDVAAVDRGLVLADVDVDVDVGVGPLPLLDASSFPFFN